MMKSFTVALATVLASTQAVQLQAADDPWLAQLSDFIALSAEIAEKLEEVELGCDDDCDIDIPEAPEVCEGTDCAEEVEDAQDWENLWEVEIEEPSLGDLNEVCTKDGECTLVDDMDFSVPEIPSAPSAEEEESCCLLNFDKEDEEEECNVCSGKGLGVLVSQNDDGTTTMKIPDACDGCKLQIELNTEEGVMEVSQVPADE